MFLAPFLSSARADDLPWVIPTFYSSEGREREVTFQGTFRSALQSLSQLEAMSEDEKARFGRNNIEPTLKFLFGPLTNRGLASPQRGMDIKVNWSSAAVVGGRVNLQYDYKATWILDKDVAETFVIPVPFSNRDLLTPRWKSCTDSAPDHQTEWFYWYFWDPKRSGCDHREGVEYQMITAHLGRATENQAASFPEYKKLLQSNGQGNRFQLTFAFGYVEDPADPKPDSDWDAGIMEYRSFASHVRTTLSGLRESKILQKEYRGASQPDKAIGRRFQGKLRGVDVVINVVAAAGIDQMELFARSFAHDHDGFFGWFGHSRVGSGFDAERFWQMVQRSPDYYSVATDYQLVYWGGCNSYSYYTLPFFEFKARAANGMDPNGTKGLDIIANGLPSYFHLNADNAAITLKHLLNWEARPSYQTIVNELEAKAQTSGIDVLVAVLGDEDNEQE